jgi:hypothetical protein
MRCAGMGWVGSPARNGRRRCLEVARCGGRPAGRPAILGLTGPHGDGSNSFSHSLVRVLSARSCTYTIAPFFSVAPSPRLEFSLVPKLSLASPLTILLHTLLLSERAVWHLIREKDFGPTTTPVLCACRDSSGRRRRRDRRYTPRTRAHRHGGAAARAGGHIAAREGKAPIRLPRSS